jgi:hypothetical protein
MKAPQSSGKKQFERHPTGWALIVCSRVIDKGTHFNPKKQKDERKITFFFESNKLMSEGDFAGQPFLLMATFNYSMFKNSFMCGFIEDWLGKNFETQEDANEFDPATLIGKKAFGNVVQNGDFDNIQPIGPVPEGMVAPDIKGKTILIDQDSLDMTEVEKLSDNMRTIVMGSKEQAVGQAGEPDSTPPVTMSENPGAGLTSEDAKGGDFNDNIPFLPYGFHTVI